MSTRMTRGRKKQIEEARQRSPSPVAVNEHPSPSYSANSQGSPSFSQVVTLGSQLPPAEEQTDIASALRRGSRPLGMSQWPPSSRQVGSRLRAITSDLPYVPSSKRVNGNESPLGVAQPLGIKRVNGNESPSGVAQPSGNKRVNGNESPFGVAQPLGASTRPNNIESPKGVVQSSRPMERTKAPELPALVGSKRANNTESQQGGVEPSRNQGNQAILAKGAGGKRIEGEQRAGQQAKGGKDSSSNSKRARPTVSEKGKGKSPSPPPESSQPGPFISLRPYPQKGQELGEGGPNTQRAVREGRVEQHLLPPPRDEDIIAEVNGETVKHLYAMWQGMLNKLLDLVSLDKAAYGEGHISFSTALLILDDLREVLEETWCFSDSLKEELGIANILGQFSDVTYGN